MLKMSGPGGWPGPLEALARTLWSVGSPLVILNRDAGLHGDDVRDVPAADLFDLDGGGSDFALLNRRANELRIDDPDDDITELAFGSNLPVFGVADGSLARSR